MLLLFASTASNDYSVSGTATRSPQVSITSNGFHGWRSACRTRTTFGPHSTSGSLLRRSRSNMQTATWQHRTDSYSGRRQ